MRMTPVLISNLEPRTAGWLARSLRWLAVICPLSPSWPTIRSGLGTGTDQFGATRAGYFKVERRVFSRKARHTYTGTTKGCDLDSQRQP